MARDFYINGECLVYVKGNGALGLGVSQNGPPGVWELGLAEENVTISPTFNHQDKMADSFGPNVPPELLWQLVEIQVRMTLVHFDKDVLNACAVESMAGGTLASMVPAGTPMGGGLPLYTFGNHWIGLFLASPVGQLPWYLPAATLTRQPLEWPLGTSRSRVQLTWRCIPYAPQPLVVPPLPSTGTNTLRTVVSGQTSTLVATGLPSTSELTCTGVPVASTSTTLTTFQSGATDNTGGGL